MQSSRNFRLESEDGGLIPLYFSCVPPLHSMQVMLAPLSSPHGPSSLSSGEEQLRSAECRGSYGCHGLNLTFVLTHHPVLVAHWWIRNPDCVACLDRHYFTISFHYISFSFSFLTVGPSELGRRGSRRLKPSSTR